MAYLIRWSSLAVSHLENILSYIAEDSPRYSSYFAKRLISLIRHIPDFPRQGRKVPEYQNENLRELIYQNYRIVYRLKKGVVEIVAITHSTRLLKNVL